MFKSIVWSSTIDYPNQVSTVLFVGTCNWNCEYCHNKNLNNNPSIKFNDILPRLLQRKEFINHIVISGGECTCYKELPQIINILKNNRFKIGIHTNGSNPQMLKNIINDIDFVGMDIKTSKNKYNTIIKSNINFNTILESINIILKSKCIYEFRTTLYPEVLKQDCLLIAQLLKCLNIKQYILQQFEDSYVQTSLKPYSIEYIKEIKDECSKIIPTILKGW